MSATEAGALVLRCWRWERSEYIRKPHPDKPGPAPKGGVTNIWKPSMEAPYTHWKPPDGLQSYLRLRFGGTGVGGCVGLEGPVIPKEVQLKP